MSVDTSGYGSSLRPDPNLKGSYYRRIQDIDRALEKLAVRKLSPTIQFLVYYFACEKLAHGIVGICSGCPASVAYRAGRRLKLREVKSSAAALGLSVAEVDLEYLFASEKQQEVFQSKGHLCKFSARYLRNKLGHDFGPTNVGNVTSNADFLIPRMTRFLSCGNETLTYLTNRFSNS